MGAKCTPARLLSFLPLSNEDIETIGRLAQQAGELALSMREGVDISYKVTLDDKVTSADRALSKLITTAIKERFPSDCVISEEDDEDIHSPKHSLKHITAHTRVWMIDPIDGTQNYILGDGQYCVMIGLIIDMHPVFGWVYEPHTNKLYFGGPNFGAFKRRGNTIEQIENLEALDITANARLAMGSRDRKQHNWIEQLAVVDIVKVGSIGLKVARILEREADVFAHLSCKLKTWDTAGPAAIALGAGLEVGGMDFDQLLFALPDLLHNTSIIMGRPGSLAWCRNHLRRKM